MNQPSSMRAIRTYIDQSIQFCFFFATCTRGTLTLQSSSKHTEQTREVAKYIRNIFALCCDWENSPLRSRTGCILFPMLFEIETPILSVPLTEIFSVIREVKLDVNGRRQTAKITPDFEFFSSYS